MRAAPLCCASQRRGSGIFKGRAPSHDVKVSIQMIRTLSVGKGTLEKGLLEALKVRRYTRSGERGRPSQRLSVDYEAREEKELKRVIIRYSGEFLCRRCRSRRMQRRKGNKKMYNDGRKAEKKGRPIGRSGAP